MLVQNVGCANSAGSMAAGARSAREQENFAGILNIAKRMECIPGGKYAKNGRITVADMERQLREEAADFKKEMNHRLRALGIDVSRPFELDFGADGLVVVVGGHPDKERIEKMFAEDFDLRNTMAKICSWKELLERGREAAVFQQEYAKEPRAAVARYSHLFSGQVDRYTMLFKAGNGNWDWDFRKSRQFRSRP